MEEAVWKFEIDINKGSVWMPPFAKILTMQTQLGKPHIWALVRPCEVSRFLPREFEVAATGQSLKPLPGKRREYIGTYQQGSFVWHVFEILPF